LLGRNFTRKIGITFVHVALGTAVGEIMFRGRPIGHFGIPLAMLGLALFALSTDAAGFASRLRGSLFDFYQTTRPRPYVRTPVRVLKIDTVSLDRYGAWPWPHARLAELVDALKTQGVAGVVLTSPIVLPDPTSPQNLLGLVPPGPAFDSTRLALSRMSSPDNALAAALRGTKSVLGFTLDADKPAPSLKPKAAVAWTGNRDPLGHLAAVDQAFPPLALLAEASAGLGAVTLATDPDGVIRRMPLAFRVKNIPVPSLEAEVLRLMQSSGGLTLKSDDGHGGMFPGVTGIRAVETARGDVPLSPDGRFWIA
jgi:adenylate cyclase